MAKQTKRTKGANGYKLPEPFPKGEILTDISKKLWVLGESIGQGGFGEIYSARDASVTSTEYPYVVKIEPHENGPLFVEINFFIRNAKAQEIEDFMNKKKMKSLGMPVYLGSGSHEFKNKKYRFLVMQKFGEDISKLLLKNGRKFPTSTVFQIGTQMLDVFEYIHDHGYVHADLKGANILLGNSEKTKNQCFLIDFGLAVKFVTDKVFKPNPKKAHDGTIEYLSRDAHKGVPTRRGDLEVLAYNLIQWLGCKLPWENELKNPSNVEKMKEDFMSNINQSLKKCFLEGTPPSALADFLNYINSLSFDSAPDYTKIKKMFITEIEKNGKKLTSPLFSKELKLSPKRKIVSNNIKSKRVKKDSGPENKPGTSKEKQTRAESESVSDDEVEKGATKKNQKKRKVNGVAKKVQKEEKKNGDMVDKYEGYTAEMKAIAMKKDKNAEKKVSKKQENKNENKDSTINGEQITRSRRNLKPVNYKDL